MEVEVHGNDIDDALYRLKKLMGKDGVHGANKRRLAFPKASLRKKEKAKIAERRRVKSERRRERFEARC